jgi:hypothetical protein
VKVQIFHGIYLMQKWIEVKDRILSHATSIEAGNFRYVDTALILFYTSPTEYIKISDLKTIKAMVDAKVARTDSLPHLYINGLDLSYTNGEGPIKVMRCLEPWVEPVVKRENYDSVLDFGLF